MKLLVFYLTVFLIGLVIWGLTIYATVFAVVDMILSGVSILNVLMLVACILWIRFLLVSGRRGHRD